jgi:hypothetical protein
VSNGVGGLGFDGGREIEDRYRGKLSWQGGDCNTENILQLDDCLLELLGLAALLFHL